MPVNKRASLPGASELFRPTKAPEPVTPAAPADPEKAKPQKSEPQGKEKASRPVASGRIRHDQKITVYFSSEELFALEDATLELKRRHGINLDRGRWCAPPLLGPARPGCERRRLGCGAELNQK